MTRICPKNKKSYEKIINIGSFLKIQRIKSLHFSISLNLKSLFIYLAFLPTIFPFSISFLFFSFSTPNY